MAKSKTEELAQEFYDILADVYGQSPWRVEQLYQTLAEKGTWQYRLTKAGENKSCAFIIYKEIADELEIYYLAVKTGDQRQGRATRLINEVLKKGKPVYLEVRASNQKAQAVYRRAGFKQISVRKNYYSNPVEDAILMKHEGYNGR